MTGTNIMISGPEECCGCGVCYDACSRNAITFTMDREGFRMPKVDTGGGCVLCGQCVSVCPMLSANGTPLAQYMHKGGNPHAYAAYSRHETDRDTSASGGVFPVLARVTLDAGGIVYGAAFNDQWDVVHIPAEDEHQLKRLLSSKYAQSDASGIYCHVRESVMSGRQVLFSGTPCQAYALKNYLKRDYDNLLCVDLFCHGVASPGLFRRYLEETTQGRGEIQSISFRDKTLNWEQYAMCIQCKNTDYWKPYRKDAYLRSFIDRVSLRKACYTCRAKGFPRKSDITLGDFWMVSRMRPYTNDHRGLSLVLLHTMKGVVHYQMAVPQLHSELVMSHDLIEHYAMSGKPVHRPEQRERFFDLVAAGSIAQATESCCKRSLRCRLMQTLRKAAMKLHVYERLRNIKKRLLQYETK